MAHHKTERVLREVHVSYVAMQWYGMVCVPIESLCLFAQLNGHF